MSLQNHPNFHAVQFASDIMHSFHECLRGNANMKKVDEEAFSAAILTFVEQMESVVDKSAK